MKMIEPMTVTEARVLDSNVQITETEWSAGTYNTGDQRYVGMDLYEVVAETSTDDEPVAGSKKAVPTWLRVGAINRFAAFDSIIGRATTKSSGVISWRIQGDGIINGIALFGLSGISATVRILRALDDHVLYTKTWTISGRGDPETWWEWFFTPFEETFSVLITDGPPVKNTIIEIEVDGGGAPVSVGEVFVGTIQSLGVTLFGTSIEEEDFSRKDRDTFGNFTITERAATSRVNYTVLVDRNQLARVQRLLRDRRAKITVYIGSENDPVTIIPGFPRNTQMVPITPTKAEMLFEVEGLI